MVSYAIAEERVAERLLHEAAAPPWQHESSRPASGKSGAVQVWQGLGRPEDSRPTRMVAGING
jgi:hypothetical protein